MKIGVLGVGGVGGVIGGYLAKAGHDVTLIDAWAASIERIKEAGLTVTTQEGEFTVKAAALHIGEVSIARPAFDVVILSVKSNETSWTSKFIEPYLAPGGFVVSAQNSINEDAVAEVLGWPRVVGCIVTLGAGMYEPGHPERTSSIDEPAFILGEPNGLITKRLERLAAVMGDVGITKTTTNLWGERWAKLAFNSMTNAVAGFTGLTTAGLALNPDVRPLMVRIAAEVVGVAEAYGVSVEPIFTAPARTFAQALEDRSTMAEIESFMIESSKAIGHGLSSLTQDLLKGRAIEVDYLNGYVVRKGQQVGVRTPVNQAIIDLTLRVYSGEIEPSVSNLELIGG